MRRVWASALCLCLLTGCSARLQEPYRRQMDDLSLLRVAGVDAAAVGVELTAAADGAGEVLRAQKETLAGALRATREQGERGAFYGHVDRLLLGEELAGQGIAPVLDCLARDAELGADCRLWVVRGAAAQAVEQVSGLPARLEQLERGRDVPGAVDAMGVLAREGSLWLPALAVEEGDVRSAGYAVVRKGLLVGYTDPEGTLGLELFTGSAAGRVAEVTVPGEGAVSLSLQQVRITCQPHFSAQTLTGLDVVCRISARVAQTAAALDQEAMDWLVYELEWQLGKGLVRVLEQAQHWDADFVGLEGRVRAAQPSRAALVTRQWAQVFRDLDIRVTALGAVEPPSA